MAITSRKLKEQPYNYTVVGIGPDVKSALADAESKLPHPLNKPQLYGRLNTQEPIQIKDGFKVAIMYDLLEDTVQTRGRSQQARARSSSYGPTDSFAVIRDISDIL